MYNTAFTEKHSQGGREGHMDAIRVKHRYFQGNAKDSLAQRHEKGLI